jgi:hypothetical protein
MEPMTKSTVFPSRFDTFPFCRLRIICCTLEEICWSEQQMFPNISVGKRTKSGVQSRTSILKTFRFESAHK